MGTVHFWTAENHDGCSYYRAEVPATALRDAGHTATVGMALPPEAMRGGCTVVAQRLHMPGPAVLWRQIGDAGVRRVYELDDDLWHLPAEHPSAEWYARRDVRSMLDICAAMADAVTVSTEPLAAVTREHTDAPVTVIPNCLPGWVIPYGDARSRHNQVLERAVPSKYTYTVGWAGSMTRSADWSPAMVRAVNRWHQRNLDALVRVYGGKSWGIDAIVVPWIDGTENYLRTVDLDVMVIPLAYNMFNQSKSHIKALECMALGIVPVCTDGAPYRRLIEDGVNGFLIDDAHDIGRLLTVLRDPGLRAEMILAGAQTAARYTIDKHVAEWEKVIF